MMNLSYIVFQLLILLELKSTADSQCTYGDVRLIGGSGDYEGNVQVCINGTWGYVCDNSWSSNDATVVCGQLGYSTSYATQKLYSYYGYGNGSIWLDYMYCTGSENTLLDCSTGVDIGVTNCGYDEMAGVFCPYGGTSCSYGDIRLVDFDTSSYGRSEGRVEVCYNGVWGTVCDDSWSSYDAIVACKQLGYYNYINYYSNAYYGQGTGSIWLDNLGCSGTESSLLSCSANSIGNHNCGHHEDAGLMCYSRKTTSCVTGTITLWSAYDSTPDNEGMILVCKGGSWYPVYHYSSCQAAEIACIATGYLGGSAITRTNAGKYYGYYYSTHYRYTCSSSDTTLSDCTESSYSSSYYKYSLGVKCEEVETANNCNNSDVRLIDGDSVAEGRVEYCYNGNWAPMCSLSGYTASQICQQLGYTKWSSIIDNESYGRLKVNSSFQYISCSSSDTSLSECSVFEQSCSEGPESCSIQYGLKCYSPTSECTNGDVRLVDGDIEQEGRPEVCVDGIWGSICDNGWSVNDAYVTCLSLGYIGHTTNPVAHYYSQFGSGSGPVVWSNVNCNHWNKDIHDCTRTEYPDFSCTTNDIAGIRCTEDCSDGDIRLVGSSSSSSDEGTVEICYDELWGLISDVGWSDNNASALVVCKQLGYTNGVARPVVGSFYGKPKKTVHLKSVNCSGIESALSDCTHTQLSLAEGKKMMTKTAVAGVDCESAPPTSTPSCTINSNNMDTCTSSEGGSIRLVDNDGIVSTSEGRVEYCNGQYWTPLCTMDDRVATLACEQLGHTQYQWATVTLLSSVLNKYSLVQNITCSGEETLIADCTSYKPTNGECLLCADYIGLRCHDPGSCREGSVRLVNGSSAAEGRVEVCVNGVWGSVCDEGWDTTDGHVVCRQLGYTTQEPAMSSHAEPAVFADSQYGDGDYPIVYSNVNCKGWEDSISDCTKDSYLDYTCPPGHVAGLKCNGVPTPEGQTSNSDSSSIVGGVLGSVMFLIVIIITIIIVFLVISYWRCPKHTVDAQYITELKDNPAYGKVGRLQETTSKE